MTRRHNRTKGPFAKKSEAGWGNWQGEIIAEELIKPNRHWENGTKKRFNWNLGYVKMAKTPTKQPERRGDEPKIEMLY